MHMLTFESQSILNKPSQFPIVSLGVNTCPNFWKLVSFVCFVFADGDFDFDFLATNSKHSLAAQFLAAGIDNDFVNPKFIGTFSDSFNKFIGCHGKSLASCCLIVVNVSLGVLVAVFKGALLLGLAP